jgi:hypothetical protein
LLFGQRYPAEKDRGRTGAKRKKNTTPTVRIIATFIILLILERNGNHRCLKTLASQVRYSINRELTGTTLCTVNRQVIGTELAKASDGSFQFREKTESDEDFPEPDGFVYIPFIY